MNEVQISIAKPEDAGALLAIYSYYILNTAVTSEVEVPTEADFRKRIETTLLRYPYLVARLDGQVVGYVYARPFHDRAAYAWSCESSIYVDRAFHGMGIGRKLYLRLEELLRQQNIVNIYASVSYPTDPDNTPYLTMDSCIFHSRLGYRNVGEFRLCRYKFGVWYNMTWMEKAIAEHRADQPDVIPFAKLRKQLGI